MPIVGFNFEKIMVERKNKITGKLDIKNNLTITNVEKEKLNITNSEDILKFNFNYTVNYQPEVGQININGHLLLMESPKQIKDILIDWEKQQKLPKDLAPQILNTILSKCNIKSLSLSQEVGLPPHVRLPLIRNK
ncbi:hypothetical protein J4438_03285 [Candidatus Woesearchaeota archaeon]|nr:hypothetical protein [Candidatus Woesearchaeota archaeon]